jgi:inner membrane protein
MTICSLRSTLYKPNKMPSAFTHIFVAGALGKTCAPEKIPMKLWVFTALCTLLPDVDIIGFYFGIRYGDVFGHRGFFHSLTFALSASLIVVFFAFRSMPRFTKRWWGLLAYFFVVMASHGFLDSMTDKGMGVGFFSPFDNTRYFMPWRPVYASPMKISKFFSNAGIEVLTAEIVWIWIPVILFYAGASLYRKKMQSLPHN